ncbi:MFS transporter [Ornithinimicrobium pratense]|uniref:MFS transporter n=1 Tax=Ornithinimicrobium pratense TaxID=2593973 RepID=UPI0017884A5A|nr:MFS transporter [Ornithinimicrobium pratense]
MASTGLSEDFGRLWAAVATSQTGTGLATGAIPFIAVEVLRVSQLHLSVIVAFSALVAGVLALPVGPWVEHHRKRPVMIAADLTRAAALFSIPIAYLADVLTYAHLLTAATLTALGHVLNNTASSAHLKALVGVDQRTAAASWIDTTQWITATAGPPIGSSLLAAVGPTVTVTLNAIAFLASALGISRIRRPEPAPPPRAPDHHWRREVSTGWRFILGHPTLRPLFINAMVFGAMIAASSPLIMYLMLDDLGLPAWLFGLALGVPALGGLVGALLAPRLERLVSNRDGLMVVLGAARAVWLIPIAFAPPGLAGAAVIIVCDTLLLVCAGAFNPLFVAHRFAVIPDELMARVSAAWTITNRMIWPISITALGALATLSSTRAAIAAAGIGLLTSALWLPWHLRRS